MHRALHICEILREIFAHVNKVHNAISYREKAFTWKSLAALTTTCKTFHEPAMNELWADLYGLMPLLGCVTRLYPLIYCSGKEYSCFDPPKFQGVKPLSENEGRQFLRHAARVRSMQIMIKDNYVHLLSVLTCTVTCMFPRLRSLSVPLPVRYSDIFLSPTLRHCDLYVTYPDLKIMATRCVALEHLSVETHGDIEDELSLMSDCIRLCKRLVTLSCAPLDWAAWKHLSNLPTLLAVTIDERWKQVVPSSLGLDNNIKFGPFLNLTTLSFSVCTAAYITPLVQHSDLPSLKRFKINVRALPWAEAERLVRALSQCKASQTLEHIDMHGGYCRVVQDPPSSSLVAITHFRCFTQLRSLRLNVPHCCTHLGNDLLVKAMSNWPHLRSLQLEDLHQTQATITFRGLLTALRQCPHLHKLALLVDAVNVDIDPTAESFRHTSLQEWDVQSAQVMDVEAVARIIFSMLPCVHMLYYRQMSMSNSPPYAWRDVERRLDHLKSSVVP
ncbi:hypothetical protein EDB19DRAFT_2042862 [Suillus lakei]|nr:hypothetical protein EDB19DRAFT_2042862 [Suillus lakei]